MRRRVATRAIMRSTTAWEYLILELPQFEPATHAPGASAAVHALNEEGERGWEAVGIIPLAEGGTAVLLKRPREILS
ncbi:MAG TPA: hypothetical protein VME46_19200 [Acidimicrobiales bacterium]|nr:hypothetical protein [Acidimicrobiales bacterium]